MKKMICAILAVVLSITLVLFAKKSEKIETQDQSATSKISSTVPDTEETESDNTTSLSVSESTSVPTSSEETNSSEETQSTEQVQPIGNLSAETVKMLNGLSNAKRSWGQGVETDEENRPIYSVTAQEDFGKYNANFIMPNEKKIYLTFDEGYENGYTSQILDTLKEKNVKAVFFITLPYAKQNKELVKRMIDEGHVVGNHSSKHLSFPTMSLEAAYNDIMTLHNYVLDEFDYEMKLFRFPMGEHSVRTLALLKELGYESVFWSYAYKDWDTENQPSEDVAFTKVTSSVHNGALYLLHAVSKANTEILGDVIDKFRQDGYAIETYPT